MTRSAASERQALQHAVERKAWEEVDHVTARLIAAGDGAAEPWFYAGVAALERHRLALAAERLGVATRRAPDRAAYWAQLARALSQGQRLPESIGAAQRALDLRPEDAVTLDTLGMVFSRADAHERAAEAFGRAAALAPGVPEFEFNLAAAQSFLGRHEEAEAAFDRCLAANPRLWRAWSSRVEVRTQTASQNRLADLEAALADAGDDADAQLHLHLALAKTWDDLGEPVRAFHHTGAGKAAKRATLRYDIAEDRALFEALHRTFRAPVEPAGVRPAGPLRIFVVGMPQTGTTLVELILSSHPAVESVGETHPFGGALKRAVGTRSPFVLDVETIERAVTADLRSVGAAYRAAAMPRRPGTRAVVDRMPLNFLYAGFIRRVLPEARVVCLRRHPLDTCLSNFRQLTTQLPSFRYAFDLLDTGRYYRLFDALTAHWRELLGGAWLELHYEDLVRDQHGTTLRLLDFCGLPWSEACLTFERNAQPAPAAGVAQVRRPLHASSVGRFRAVEAELTPLREVLGPLLET